MEWTEYDKWNEKLADYFFSGDFAQQPVYLDMEHELVERLSLEIHGNIDDVKHHFSSVIAKTLILNSTANPFQSHLGRLKYWEAGYARGEFLTPPPCIALLSFFSLIAEEMISDENFSARNYYGRLNNRLCLDDENASRLMRGYQKVKIFWETLNKWLLNCDGEYGLPTARALDSRVHVSIPISQALVRDTDRKQLKKMFVEFNLSPHQLEAPSNMKQWLNYWLLNSSNHHTSLSRLWRNNDEIRDKITLIACEELLQWDGNRSESFSRSSNSDQPHSKLTILAEFVRNPIPRLTIFLVVYGESENYRGNYEISEGTDESARKALENCNQIRLEELSQNNILSLEPWDEIYSGDLLVGTLFLERSFNNHEIFLKRQPQLLIVLTFNEQQNCYTEVNQVHLMAKNIILCRNEIFEKVSNHLLECARKGYSIFDSCQLKGLPDGWRAFTDVQIILQKENSGLETLIPSSARQLKLTGGMRIRKNIWHSQFPPIVEFASSDVTDFTIILNSKSLIDSNDEVSDRFGPYTTACSVPLKELPDGEYEIQIFSTEIIESISFSLRSGNHPLPTQIIKKPFLGFTSNQSNLLNPISPDEIDVISQEEFFESKNLLIGGMVSHDISNFDAQNSYGPDIPSELSDTGPGESEEDNHSSKLESIATLGFNCVIQGYHIWRCDEARPGTSINTLQRQKCRGCLFELWSSRAERSGRARRPTRRRGVAPQTNMNSTNISMPSPSTPLPNLEPISAGDKPRMDDLLDSISYLRKGSWEQFTQLCNSLEEGALYPYKAARILSSLGHCEFRLDPVTMRPTDFRVTFPTLVKTDENGWVLSGGRSPILLEAICNLCDHMGIELSQKVSLEHPTIFRITAPEDMTIDQITKGIFANVNQKILVSSDFSQKAIALSQPISKLIEVAHVTSINDQRLEYYNIDQNRWFPVERFSKPGAYRVRSFSSTYIFADQEHSYDGRASILEPRVVKHLEAKRTGKNLICYKEEEQCLIVAPNCELPALLDRAAAMCSGEYPKQDNNGPYIFKGITTTVANGIWSKLIN